MLKKTIYEQIAANIAENPDAPAIQELDRSVSYGDLGGLSASIAQQILLHGCPKEAFIPIITRGGIDMVAGMLGSLQAATTFVPIDADAPAERTKQMLRDLGSDIAIADSGLDCSHLISPETKVIRPCTGICCNETRGLDDHSIIYGFFTSGSTGQPKCCLNTHLGLSNRFAFNSNVRPLAGGDAVLQNSKHTFDPVLWQVLWPLTRGAKIIIPRRDGLLDIEKTVETIYREHVVMTDIVPSVLSVLLDYLERHSDELQKMQSLMELFVGGEETSIQLVRRSMKLLPWVRLTNTYGPTEAAIGMIYHHFDGTESIEVPLGKPIPGTFCYILDDGLKPVPNGETGQLAIGGNCLGIGYLNDPDKTAALFTLIETPTGRQRVFLTGDRASIADEKVYFKGRTDKQIKIRGVRIELKEIESAYEAHSEIVQFRVVPVTSQLGETRLHAFFTAHSALDNHALRSFGRSRLPPEFIPSAFERLERFETTSSGKIDRSTLRNIAVGHLGKKAIPGIKAVEDLVRKYVGDSAKSDANLFDMGLDSLNAMRLAMEIEEVFGCHLSASQLYANPTIASIQALAEGQVGKTPASEEIKQDLSRWSRISISPITPKPKILLTGATGYLGAHLLNLLSNQKGVEVYCLVRAASEARGMLRLHQSSLRYGLHEQTNWDAVHTLLGDLAQPDLGIRRADLERLSSSLAAIYNSGAEVNFVKPFSHLEMVNVLAVRRLAELALSVRGCHLHHVSSTAAIPEAEVSLDNPPVAPYSLPVGGYAQSKLAAEIMLTVFEKEGLPLTIYRVGELMPSPSHPIPNSRSNVIAYLKTLAELGVAPLEEDSLDYCPVDVAALVITGGGAIKRNFHGVANQSRVSQGLIVKGLNRAGAPIRLLHRAEVYEIIAEAARQPFAPDHIAITWAAIKAAGPDAHWPILAYSTNPNRRSGGHQDWPTINELYLAHALCSLVPAQRLKVNSLGSSDEQILEQT